MRGRGDVVETINTQEEADTMVPPVKDKEVQTETEPPAPVEKVNVGTQTEPQVEDEPPKRLIDYILPLRKPGLLQPTSRKLLEKVGDEKITSIDLVRSPIPGSGFLKRLGFYKKVLDQLYYDDLFHLAIVINDKYDFEKSMLVEFKPKVKRAKKEVFSVPLPTGFDTTIAEFIDNTRRAMGNQKFSEYNVVTNNCQNFVASALKANKIMTPEARKFTKQNIDELVHKLPKWATKLVSVATRSRTPFSAARFNRLIRGEGMEEFETIRKKTYR